LTFLLDDKMHQNISKAVNGSIKDKEETSLPLLEGKLMPLCEPCTCTAMWATKTPSKALKNVY